VALEEINSSSKQQVFVEKLYESIRQETEASEKGSWSDDDWNVCA
jgi:hypothetical protein